MDTEIAGKIADLPGLNKAELRSIWETNFDQPAPPHLRKELMVPILAYRIQEKAYGGLSPKARKKLREIAESLTQSHANVSPRASSPEPDSFVPGRASSIRSRF